MSIKYIIYLFSRSNLKKIKKLILYRFRNLKNLFLDTKYFNNKPYKICPNKKVLYVCLYLRILTADQYGSPLQGDFSWVLGYFGEVCHHPP